MSPVLRSAFLTVFAYFAVAANAAVVRGSVSNTEGVRLTGKVVTAYDASGVLRGTTTTDVSGNYALPLPAGSYRVLAYDNDGTYATAFHANADSFESSPFVQLGSADVVANFVLPLGGRVTGMVIADGAPLSGAVVEAYNLSGTRRGSTTTNASGQYSIVLPAGEYKMYAYGALGVFAGEFGGNVRAFADAPVTRVNPPAATPLSFELERAARVDGSVIDADTRAALPGRIVYVYTAAGALVTTTTTDTAGSFAVNLGPGQYRFVAGDPLRIYAPAFYDGSRSFENADVVTLSAAELRPNLTIAAMRGAVISGTVNGGAGLAVAAYNADGSLHASTVVDGAGAYAMVVAPGEYRVAAYDPAGVYATQFYQAATSFLAARPVAILAGQTLSSISFAAVRAGRFTGTVRDASTLQPLGGMTVAAYDAAGALTGEATTASNGTFTMPVAPAQYRLIVFDPRLDYATAYAGGASSYEATVPLTIVADATNTVDFAMSRGVRVTGVVRDPSNFGIDGVEVFALDASGRRVAGTTTSAGAFTFVVVAGSWEVMAIDPAHRYAPSARTPVTVGSTPPAPFTIRMTPLTRRRTVRS